MSLSDLHNMLREVFRWEPDRMAAFVIGVIFCLALGGILYWFFGSWFRSSKSQNLNEVLDMLRKERETTQTLCRGLQTENGELRQKTSELTVNLRARETEAENLRQTADALSEQCEELKDHCGAIEEAKDTCAAANKSLEAERERVAEESNSLRQQVKDLTEQMQSVANLGGKIWERPVTGPIPPFRPLATRNAPVIALTNLKGGVGKTTIAANLGATLWNQGYRVLLIDLDYQGSLTSLCLDGQEIADVRRGQRLVRKLFETNGSVCDALFHSMTRIGRSDGFLLAADEELADVEMHAMAQWFLNPDRGDLRFVLRAALHSEQVQREFDIILLDCPPRLTSASINALTSSDFVLIPVLLDLTSAEAVPRLLKWLRQLQGVVCPDLSVLGVLANRTSPRQELIAREKAVWQDSPKKCADSWEQPVYHFQTVVRQKGEFAEAASNHRFAAFSSELQSTFLDLVAELKRRIPLHESRRSPVLH